MVRSPNHSESSVSTCYSIHTDISRDMIISRDFSGELGCARSGSRRELTVGQWTTAPSNPYIGK